MDRKLVLLCRYPFRKSLTYLANMPCLKKGLHGGQKIHKKLKQQSTGWRRPVGPAEGLLGLTEVTPHALLFVLAGRQHRVAFDGQNALWGMKYTLKNNQTTINY